METYSNCINDSDSIYGSSIEENNNIFETLDEHTILNEKNNEESSPDSNKIKQINSINFEINTNDVLKSSFYNLDDLDSKNFNEIYNIIYSSPMIIFVDNYKLINLNRHNILKFFKTKKCLYKEEFPGCTFFPFEYINKFKKYIERLNNSILEGEFKNYKVYNEDELCYGICFDEGEIFKDVLYKKMEIINRILFIPINKYHIKETEYKIRGFCQIVEELGAKKIEITFQKNDRKISKKKLNTSLGSDIELIAGNLGLTNSKSDEDNEDHKYILKYPLYNTIILNEKSIRKKIKRKKMIISETIYNSNLELQYLIRSRCRHFITNYSTTFTLDSNSSIDKILALKFKSHNIDLGLNFDTSSNKKNYLQIITNIEFVNDIEYGNNIMGSSVSYDNIGFQFLINTLKTQNNFKDIGIYKIIDFINIYIEKVIKHSSEYDYEYISDIMEKIKKEFTLKEYANLLCNYFDVNSQWIHFTNFIDILQNKSKSYDKLGYLTTINYNIKCIDTKINNIVKFIQELCIQKNIENKFWEMLKSNKKELYVFLKDKLINTYNIVDTFNWYNLNSLLNDISNYEVNFNIDNDEEYLKKLINNMNLGYKYYEFYNRMVPFIIRRAQSLNYDGRTDIFLFNIFEESLNYESFNVYKINNMNKLDNYILQKIDKINNINSIVEDIANKYSDRDNIEGLLVKYFNSTHFKNKYPYFNKKINIIMPKNKIENLQNIFNNIFNESSYINRRNSKKYIINEDIKLGKISAKMKTDTIKLDNNYKNNIIIFLKRIIVYNEKININKLPICTYTFDLIFKNYKNGVKEIDFYRYIIPFIKKLLDIIINGNMIGNIKNINSFKNSIINNKEYDDFDYKVTNFYDLINYIKDEIENNNYILTKDLIMELTYL